MSVKLFKKKWTGITSSRGSFYCPVCRTQKDYHLKTILKVYTVLGMPVFPARIEGCYVECKNCRQTFWESVLECSPELTKARFHPAVLKIMVLIMLADGRIEDSEMESIMKVYREVTGKEITRDEIESEIASTKPEDITIEDYLKRLTPYLNNFNKELIVKSAFLVSISDGIVREEEKIVLYEICHALGMKTEHFNSILRELQIKEDENGNEDVEQDIFQIPEEDI